MVMAQLNHGSIFSALGAECLDFIVKDVYVHICGPV